MFLRTKVRSLFGLLDAQSVPRTEVRGLSNTLTSETPNIFGFVTAIIDTGSPTSILGGADIQRMRISQIQMQKLVGEEKEVNLESAQIKTRILPDAHLSISNKIKVKIPLHVPVKIIRGIPPPTIIGLIF